MSGGWEREIAAFAEREGLTADQADAIRRFVEAKMRVDSVEVSVDTFADRTTQMFTATTEMDLEPGELPMPRTPERRYLDFGRIGIGGMGEVRRVRDTVLNRFVAMKTLRPEWSDKRTAILRFLAEAQATAQLQHPGVVPVHDLGQLEDGRWFFTMKELRGDTLEELLRSYRAGQAERGLRGVLEVLVRACDAVAYAHAHGAIHRDLKPSNILIGSFGEVVVLDWGLVKATGAPPGTTEPVAELHTLATRFGAVIGTPAYMPPEQARGDLDTIGPPADVYALGSILYEILSGRRPYSGDTRTIVDRLLSGPPAPLPATVPAGLAAICERCLARSPRDRYADAGALAGALRAWLDGAARRERALALVERADHLQPEVESLLARSEELLEEAEQHLASVPSWAPTEAKLEGWRLEDEALRARIEADRIGLERLQLLRSALVEDPEMPEAQERLAYVYHFCHARAEKLKDAREMAHYEALLRAYDRGTYAHYLEGTGRLSLVTRPPGRRAILYRLHEEHRRLVPRKEALLPPTPLRSHPLGHGSWLLVFEEEGRLSTRYPVYIEREGHWDGVPPGGTASAPVPLPWSSDVEPGVCYVPAGWCILGERPSRAWVDGFFIDRHPVTNEDYVVFLNALLDRGDEELAVRVQPMTVAGPCFGRGPDGRFTLDSGTARWDPRWPVVYVDQPSAMAYANWRAIITGLPWRLPWEDEWEKAARGVDGRRYVTGDFLDPSWAAIHGSSATEGPVPIDAFPTDTSVYGVRGLTGGVMDWCLDAYRGSRMRVVRGRVERIRAKDDGPALCRGGCRTAPSTVATTTHRHPVPRHERSAQIGFRLVRSAEPEREPEASGVWILRPDPG